MKKLLGIVVLGLLWGNTVFALPKCQGEDISKWTMCKGVKITSKGSKYSGEFKDGKYHGQGTINNVTGDQYTGGFKSGKFYGKGTLTHSNGEKKSGVWKDGKVTESIFKILDLPKEFERAKKIYPKYINVFGIHIFASKKVRDEKLIHAANVMAEYLDNDEDGVPDNKLVVDKLFKKKAVLFMSKNESQWEKDIDKFWNIYGSKGIHGQSLYDVETNPGGRGFDASLEEVLHLITEYGYAHTYPKELGDPSSLLAKAMDKARGGKFKKVPKKYPKDAWYSYYDKTCTYICMKGEYIYWALTSYLGAQKNRGDEISHEWKAYTKKKLIKMDPDVVKLLTNPKFKFPTKLPDGEYNPN